LLGLLMAVWAVVILPIIIKVNIALGDDFLPVVIFHFKTIGFSFYAKGRLVIDEDGLDFKISFQHRLMRPEKSMKGLRGKNGAALNMIRSDQKLLKNLFSYVSSAGIHLKLRIGSGNAATTAMLCGLLNAALGCVPRIHLQIVPDFRTTQVCMQLKCIASFHLGKLLVSAAVLLRSAVMQAVREKAGGLVRG